MSANFASMDKMEAIEKDRQLLSELMEFYDLKAAALARKVDVTPSTFSRLLNQGVGHQLSGRTHDKIRAACPEFFDKGGEGASQPLLPGAAFLASLLSRAFDAERAGHVRGELALVYAIAFRTVLVLAASGQVAEDDEEAIETAWQAALVAANDQTRRSAA